PPAHAGGRGGDARLLGQVRRRPGTLGDRGAAARLRLRALPQRGALAHRGAPELGRAAVARQRATRVAVPSDPGARELQRRAERDELALAMDRACGARPIEGNRIDLYSESPRALDAMLELVARAERWIHFENYIIRGDRTGRRFADALAARARAGVRVRVLYD